MDAVTAFSKAKKRDMLSRLDLCTSRASGKCQCLIDANQLLMYRRIPFDRALEFANKEKITEALYPLFVHDIGALLYHPTNRAGPAVGGYFVTPLTISSVALGTNTGPDAIPSWAASRPWSPCPCPATSPPPSHSTQSPWWRHVSGPASDPA